MRSDIFILSNNLNRRPTVTIELAITVGIIMCRNCAVVTQLTRHRFDSCGPPLAARFPIGDPFRRACKSAHVTTRRTGCRCHALWINRSRDRPLVIIVDKDLGGGRFNERI